MITYIYVFSVPDPDLETVKIDVWSCLVCGALVVDQQQHSDWHKGLEKLPIG